jgi:hypothetical protein
MRDGEADRARMTSDVHGNWEAVDGAGRMGRHEGETEGKSGEQVREIAAIQVARGDCRGPIWQEVVCEDEPTFRERAVRAAASDGGARRFLGSSFPVVAISALGVEQSPLGNIQ